MKKACSSIPEETLAKLLKLRKDMLISPKNDKCSLGKLAFDTNNKEFGFIIGPITLDKDTKEGVDVKRALLVTLGEEGPRVRYSRLNNIRTFNDTEEGVDDLNKVIRTDVSEFCNNLCIHDCSNDCVLFKYKNNENFNK